MAGPEEVLVEHRDGCAWVTLNRPPLNLLTPGLIARLYEIFASLRREETVRAAVIAATGPHMTGGMQIEELRDLSPSSAERLISELRDAIEAVHEAPFPTIAMVNGVCLGAGLELVMACDMRIASKDARFGLPEVRAGIPSVIHAALLPHLVGPGRAAELLLTGESISGVQALAWGLVNRGVEPSDLRAATERLIGDILKCGPQAIRLQKALIIRWRNSDLRTAISAGVEAFGRAYASDEPRLAMEAFLEKPPATFD